VNESTGPATGPVSKFAQNLIGWARALSHEKDKPILVLSASGRREYREAKEKNEGRLEATPEEEWGNTYNQS